MAQQPIHRFGLSGPCGTMEGRGGGSLPQGKGGKKGPSFKAGDPVLVYIEKIEDDEGRLILSKEKADVLRAWVAGLTP